MDFQLRVFSSPAWLETVLGDMDAFLLDHAAAEKKASAMAMSMLSHYPDRPELVAAMADLAVEEMMHFREVVRICQKRKLTLGSDTRDAYVIGLRSAMRKGREVYLLDRLLVASIVEARGHERFRMIADGLAPGELQTFYQAIARSEARHYQLFLSLAEQYFAPDVIRQRLDELLSLEAEIVRNLPLRPALH